MDDEALAAYQERLLVALYEAAGVDAVEDVRRRLLQGVSNAELREYIATFDSRSVEVGIAIVQKWSVRRTGVGAAEPRERAIATE